MNRIHENSQNQEYNKNRARLYVGRTAKMTRVFFFCNYR